MSFSLFIMKHYVRILSNFAPNLPKKWFGSYLRKDIDENQSIEVGYADAVVVGYSQSYRDDA